MKVAVLSESAADEAAVQILCGAILDRPTEPVSGPALRSRGWPSVATILPAVIKYLYYQTAADGLVIVVDANSSLIHEAGHEKNLRPNMGCRWCRLRVAASETTAHPRAVHGRGNLRIAIGLAVPAIEAWYHAGIDARVTEANWMQIGRRGTPPYTKAQLKLAVYGTDRPSIELETQKAVEQATRVAQDLTILETAFPNGFQPLIRMLRAW